MWKSYRSTDKRYSRDNRLMTFESSYRRSRLAPRCRLITSWSWNRFQGFGCSPIKVVRELGLERREAVRSLSVVGVGKLREADFSTRGLRRGNLWCTGCLSKALPGSYVTLKESLKAYKREINLKRYFPKKIVEDYYVDRSNVYILKNASILILIYLKKFFLFIKYLFYIVKMVKLVNTLDLESRL